MNPASIKQPTMQSLIQPKQPSAVDRSARLVALKQQIHANNQLLHDATTKQSHSDTGTQSNNVSIHRRRHSLLRLHQQAMELMPGESLDPFATIEAKEELVNQSNNPSSNIINKRHTRTPSSAACFSPLTQRHHISNRSISSQSNNQSNNQFSPSTFLTDLPDEYMQQSINQTNKQARIRMNDSLKSLLLKISSNDDERQEEEKMEEEVQTINQTINQDLQSIKRQFRSGSVQGTLARSTPKSKHAIKQPIIQSTVQDSSNNQSINQSPPLTPRMQFFKQRASKFDDSVKVMMSLTSADMERIRSSIIAAGGGVDLPQFLAIASRKYREQNHLADESENQTSTQLFDDSVDRSPSRETSSNQTSDLSASQVINQSIGYEREIEALAAMFSEIDVNGDGDLQYSEMTSYLVELANGRYDSEHIDRLINQRYHSMNVVENPDHIDVLHCKYHPAMNMFTLFEKGQHRFKALDSSMNEVAIIRGHQGNLIDAEYLPMHGVLVTSASDRMLKFWSVDFEDPSTTPLPNPTCNNMTNNQSSKPSRRSTSSSTNQSKGYEQTHQPINRNRMKTMYTPVTIGSATKKSSKQSINQPTYQSDGPTFNQIASWSLPSPQVCLCWFKTRLYSADILGRLIVWNIDVGSIKQSINAHQGSITCLVACADRGWLISGGIDGWVRIWDVQDMHLVDEYMHDQSNQQSNTKLTDRSVTQTACQSVEAIAYDADRGLIHSGGDDDRVCTWDCEQKTIVRTFEFSSSNKQAAKQSNKQSNKYSNRQSPNQANNQSANDSILGLTVNGHELLVMSQFGVFRVIDCNKWSINQSVVLPRQNSEHHDSDDESSSQTNNEYKEPVSMRSKELVTSWTIMRSSDRSNYQSSANNQPTNQSSSQSIVIVCAGTCLYPFTRASSINRYVADSAPIIDALYNPSNFTILTGAGQSVKVWCAITGRLLQEFHDLINQSITCMSLDHRGRKLIVSSADGCVYVFNSNTGAAMQTLAKHAQEVRQVVYIPYIHEQTINQTNNQPSDEQSTTNKIVCVSSSGIYVHHDDAESQGTSLYHSSSVDRSEITSIDWSTTNRLIVSGCLDGSCLMYPGPLDGTSLQKLWVPGGISVCRFIDPYRLLLIVTLTNQLCAYVYTAESMCLIATLDCSASHQSINQICHDGFTGHLYMCDEQGTIKCWPIMDALVDCYKSWHDEATIMLNKQHQENTLHNLSTNKQSINDVLPTSEQLDKYWGSPRKFSLIQPLLNIQAHKSNCASISLIPGREPKYSEQVENQRAVRERAIDDEEEIAKDKMEIEYEQAVLTTAQVLHESLSKQRQPSEQSMMDLRQPIMSPLNKGRASSRISVIELDTKRSSVVDPNRLSASFEPSQKQHDAEQPQPMSLPTLRSKLPPDLILTLDKECRRVARSMQSEHVAYFSAARSSAAAMYASEVDALNQQYGSPTVILSCGEDGCVYVWSAENGERLGELHQGEVGQQTPKHWKFYVNMEARRAEERVRLRENLQAMEEFLQEGMSTIESAEAAAAAAEDEDEMVYQTITSAHDSLPVVTAANQAERKMLAHAEQLLLGEIANAQNV